MPPRGGSARSGSSISSSAELIDLPCAFHREVRVTLLPGGRVMNEVHGTQVRQQVAHDVAVNQAAQERLYGIPGHDLDQVFEITLVVGDERAVHDRALVSGT